MRYSGPLILRDTPGLAVGARRLSGRARNIGAARRPDGGRRSGGARAADGEQSAPGTGPDRQQAHQRNTGHGSGPALAGSQPVQKWVTRPALSRASTRAHFVEIGRHCRLERCLVVL